MPQLGRAKRLKNKFKPRRLSVWGTKQFENHRKVKLIDAQIKRLETQREYIKQQGGGLLWK